MLWAGATLLPLANLILAVPIIPSWLKCTVIAAKAITEYCNSSNLTAKQSSVNDEISNAFFDISQCINNYYDGTKGIENDSIKHDDITLLSKTTTNFHFDLIRNGMNITTSLAAFCTMSSPVGILMFMFTVLAYQSAKTFLRKLKRQSSQELNDQNKLTDEWFKNTKKEHTDSVVFGVPDAAKKDEEDFSNSRADNKEAFKQKEYIDNRILNSTILVDSIYPFFALPSTLSDIKKTPELMCSKSILSYYCDRVGNFISDLPVFFEKGNSFLKLKKKYDKIKEFLNKRPLKISYNKENKNAISIENFKYAPPLEKIDSEENISDTIEDKLKDINDNNLDFEKGTFYQIKGKSGVGKTTFLKSIMGNNLCSSGKVTFGYDKSEVFGISDHANFPENLSIFEAICYPEPKKDEKTKEKIKELMDDLGGMDELKDKLDKPQKGHLNVSNGQRKKLRLISALIKDAKVLVLDEFFANIDESGKKNVMKVIKKNILDKDGTVLAVDHNELPTTEITKKEDVTIVKDDEGKIKF